MLRSGVAPLASLEDLDEVVSILRDPSPEEEGSQIQDCCRPSSSDTLLPEVDSQKYRKECFISTLNMLKDLLKCERGTTLSSFFESLNEILKNVEQIVQNPSTAMDQDLINAEKVKSLVMLCNKMSPLESGYIRIVLFGILSQLQRSTLTMRQTEESPSLAIQVRDIVQKLLVFVRTTRCDHESILQLQRDMANLIWRLNRLDIGRERIKGWGYMNMLLNVCNSMLMLNNYLLSSSVEKAVVLWPSLEYYAQGRDSTPVNLNGKRRNAVFHTFTYVNRSSQEFVWYLKVMQSHHWLHLALEEMLLEQQEWADYVSRRQRSRNGGELADMDTVSIGSILKEALRTTSSILGIGTNPVVMYQETCSLFPIEYLDDSKFINSNDIDIISGINKLVCLYHILLRLRCSLVKLVEDYVQESEIENDAEPGQDIYASYLVYDGRYIFKEEDGKLLHGTSLTPMDDIPYADDAMGVEDSNVASEVKMEIFQERFRRQIRLIHDDRSLRLGDAVFRVEKLSDRALTEEQIMRESLMKELADRSAFEKRLTDAYSPGASRWRRRNPMPIDGLLFGVEREVLREMVSSREDSVLDKMYRVALTTWEVDESWKTRNFHSNMDDSTLGYAVITHCISTLPREKLRAQNIDVSSGATRGFWWINPPQSLEKFLSLINFT